MRFLITSLTSWDEIPRARHQVTEELIRAGHEVVFVEKNRIGVFRVNVRKEKPGLTLVTPFFPVDYRFRFRLPGLNELYQWWTFRSLKKKFGDLLVINFDYTAHLVSRFFENTIYYCNDDYIGNSKYPVWIVNRYHEFVEKRTAKLARFCVGTADSLMEKLSRYNPKTYKIPLGGPNPANLNTVRAFREQGKIRVGLMGTIKSNYVSPVIINRLLEEPSMELVFIGKVESSFSEQVDDMTQIEVCGVLTGDELYREMSKFDVAIAPYDVEEINVGGTPNKLFQYLACGCPVVMTALPSVSAKNYPAGMVYVAEEEGFASMIRKASDEDCQEFFERRKTLAAENTWEKRVEEFLFHLSEHGLI